MSEFWNSIPGQLAKENKKFKYSEIRKGARSSSYEQTVEWLRKAGCADYSKFKIYLHDVGLLGAQLHISSDLIVEPGRIFSEWCFHREFHCSGIFTGLMILSTYPFMLHLHFIQFKA